jgi:hypothetical protein
MRLATDLHAHIVTYLASGGKIGDIIRAEVTCDKCTYERLHRVIGSILLSSHDLILKPSPEFSDEDEVD